MLTRIWAVIRTIYLLAVVAYALWAMPWSNPTVARTFDEQYARCANSNALLQRAVWLAIAWIALETLIGWTTVWSAARAARTAAARLPTPGKPTEPGRLP
jgi:heme A synthase